MPDQIDARTHNKAQAYLDYIEWLIAAGYDTIGFSHDESDRRASSTLTGALVGAVAGAEIVSVPAAFAGCGVGAVVGAIAGGTLGAAAAGVGLPFGAGAGAGLGCLAGVALAAAPGIAVGAMTGAITGGAAFGALGAGVDIPEPATPPPLIEGGAPVPELSRLGEDPAKLGDAIADGINTFAASDPLAESVVTSLQAAIAALPPLSPILPNLN
ncbi:hypothetical protein [Nocardia tengchongensis]|uniref:hypothetical protein n=1 Tax=Nocardia tengchongensis TaxID=2055889 RepID=UPI0036683A25